MFKFATIWHASNFVTDITDYTIMYVYTLVVLLPRKGQVGQDTITV